MPKLNTEFDTSIGSRVRMDTKEQLNKLASENYRTLSMQVRMILEKHLDKVKQKTTKRQGVC